jgi:endonuclease/exonuclease/phosphatase family metal-dependent hydrolase
MKVARVNKRDISFATFNLLNLQEPGKRTYSNKAMFANDAQGHALYAQKLEWIAIQIKQLDATVIAFQELWSKASLIEVFEQAHLLQEYDIIARDAPARGRPQVAIAVKKSANGKSQVLDNGHWIESFPEHFEFTKLRERHHLDEEITLTLGSFSRPVLHVQISLDATRPKTPVIDVYVAHLKSKRPASLSFASPRAKVLQHYSSIVKIALSHIRRVMEAAALRAIIEKKLESEDSTRVSPVVVLGDLNDDASSITNDIITGQPAYRVSEKSRRGHSSDKGLYSAQRLQQYRSVKAVYYTHIYQDKRESLDHIFVSQEFYDHSDFRLWSFSDLQIYNDHLNREYSSRQGASDHGIVKAQFDWNPSD